MMSDYPSNEYIGDTIDYYKRAFIQSLGSGVLLIKPVHLQGYAIKDYRHKLKTFFGSSCDSGIITLEKEDSEDQNPKAPLVGILEYFAELKKVQLIKVKDGDANVVKHLIIDPPVGLCDLKKTKGASTISWGKKGPRKASIYLSVNILNKLLEQKKPGELKSITIYQHIRNSADIDKDLSMLTGDFTKESLFSFLYCITFPNCAFITFSRSSLAKNDIIKEQLTTRMESKLSVYKLEQKKGWIKIHE